MERSGNFYINKRTSSRTLGVDESKVTEDARFKEDLDADSLDIVEFVMGMEESLKLNFQKMKLKALLQLVKQLT